MKAILVTRKSQMVFLVPDNIAMRFEKTTSETFGYDELMEALDGLEGRHPQEFCIIDRSEGADLEEIISEKRLFEQYADRGSHADLIRTIEEIDNKNAGKSNLPA